VPVVRRSWRDAIDPASTLLLLLLLERPQTAANVSLRAGSSPEFSP